MLRIYLNQNVYEAALERIRYIFDEFDCVGVNISGGKDSTIILNLALKVAEEKGRLPLRVYFIDTESEWQCVIDHMRKIMADPRVRPYWLQIPLKMFNATSASDMWLHSWEEGKKWMREKEEISRKVNVYGVDRFAKLYEKILEVDFPPRSCLLAGVRCEESTLRYMGLTYAPTYKGITWGKIQNRRREQYSFYPIYDWTFSDVWKAIHDFGWEYCRLYDLMYQRGIPSREMRVSGLHHINSLITLFFLQEIEPDTWNRLVERLGGIATIEKLEKSFFGSRKLPAAFQSWKEYRDFLLERMISDPFQKEKFREKFSEMDRTYKGMRDISILHREQIKAILMDNYELNSLNKFHSSFLAGAFRKFMARKGRVKRKEYARYIPTDQGLD